MPIIAGTDFIPQFPLDNNDETTLLEGQIGIKFRGAGGTPVREMWYRLIRENASDPAVDPVLLGNVDGIQSSKNNFGATVDPTASDDAGSGFGYGSLWHNNSTGQLWVCDNPTVGSVVWSEVGEGGGVETVELDLTTGTKTLTGASPRRVILSDGVGASTGDLILPDVGDMNGIGDLFEVTNLKDAEYVIKNSAGNTVLKIGYGDRAWVAVRDETGGVQNWTASSTKQTGDITNSIVPSYQSGSFRKIDGLLNGIAPEKQAVSFAVVGVSVAARVTNSADPGSNLPVVIGDVEYELSIPTTPGYAEVFVPQGTALVPKISFLYVYLNSGVPTLACTETYPTTGDFCILGDVICRDYTLVPTQGVYFQRFNNSVEDGDEAGLLQRIAQRIRVMGAAWGDFGVESTVTITTNVGAPDNVDLTLGVGACWQLNRQIFPGTDGSFYEVLNHPTGVLRISDLNEIDVYADGSSIQDDDVFGLNFIAIISSDGGVSACGVLLPTAGYEVGGFFGPTDEDALNDSSNYAVTTVPAASKLNKITFRTSRTVFRYTTTSGGTWDNVVLEESAPQTYQDERGFLQGSGSGSAAVSNNDPAAVHVNVASEIDGVTEKTALAMTDVVLLESAANSYEKRKASYQSVANRVMDSTIDKIDLTSDSFGAVETDTFLNINAGSSASLSAATNLSLTANSVNPLYGISLDSVKSLRMKRQTGVSYQDRQLWLDSADDCLNLYNEYSSFRGMLLGRQHRLRVINNTGSTIADSDLVYVSGYDATNDLYEVSLASYNTAAVQTAAVGIATSMVDGAPGEMCWDGLARCVVSAGDIGNDVYVGSSLGDWTTTPPVGATVYRKIGQAVSGGIFLGGVPDPQRLNVDSASIGGNGVDGILTARITPGTITTSDDGTTTLSTGSRCRVILNGSGINHQTNLGAATQYEESLVYEITNNSSEFTHFLNSDSSKVWHIPPTCTARFYLADNATAAGVWSVDISAIQREDGYEAHEESALNQLDWANFGTGGGAASGTYALRRAGYIRTGTITTGNYGQYLALGTENSTGAYIVETYVGFPNLSSALQRFNYYHGIDDQVSTVGEGYGIYFIYDDTISPNWIAKTVDSSGNTSTTTTVAVTTSYQHIMFVVASDGSRVDFWIAGEHVTSITTNIPDPSIMRMRRWIEKSTGVTNTYAYFTDLSNIKVFNSSYKRD